MTEAEPLALPVHMRATEDQTVAVRFADRHGQQNSGWRTDPQRDDRIVRQIVEQFEGDLTRSPQGHLYTRFT